jgi:hypothetical protein
MFGRSLGNPFHLLLVSCTGSKAPRLAVLYRYVWTTFIVTEMTDSL